MESYPVFGGESADSPLNFHCSPMETGGTEVNGLSDFGGLSEPSESSGLTGASRGGMFLRSIFVQ